jgi:hypothetical protein
MAYTFMDGAAKTQKKSQYYEMLGSRAIWADGWKAVVWHKKDSPYTEDKWELYHTDEDPTEFNDLAAANPAKLTELQGLWRKEAEANGVFPLDDRRYERVADPTRPVAAQKRDEYTYYPGTSIVHPTSSVTSSFQWTVSELQSNRTSRLQANTALLPATDFLSVATLEHRSVTSTARPLPSLADWKR